MGLTPEQAGGPQGARPVPHAHAGERLGFILVWGEDENPFKALERNAPGGAGVEDDGHAAVPRKLVGAVDGFKRHFQLHDHQIEPPRVEGGLHILRDQKTVGPHDIRAAVGLIRAQHHERAAGLNAGQTPDEGGVHPQRFERFKLASAGIVVPHTAHKRGPSAQLRHGGGLVGALASVGEIASPVKGADAVYPGALLLREDGVQVDAANDEDVRLAQEAFSFLRVERRCSR